MDNNLTDEKAKELEEAQKEYMEMMAAYNEPHFANIWRRVSNLDQLI